MSFVVETSDGLVNATAYATEAQVLAYLTDRNRQAENTWSSRTAVVQRAAIIAASDYIDHRFGASFLGRRQFIAIAKASATGVLTGTAQFADTETVVIGSRTYTFVATLSAANQILIGVDLATSLSNLVAAINGAAGEGSTYGTGTTALGTFTATSDSTTLTITAVTAGRTGNDVALSETAANASWGQAATTGGANATDVQGLEFPRLGIVLSDGRKVTGVPDEIIQATAEYAVRAVAATLAPDPTADETGGVVVESRVKVGPIEESKRYQDGSTDIRSAGIRAYPAADRLLRPLLRPAGVIR